MTAVVRWKLRKTPAGYEGMVILPASLTAAAARGQLPGRAAERVRALHPSMRDKPIAVKATATSAAGALAKAAGIAQKLAGNPLLQAIMPPGTGAAVSTIAKLAKSKAAGKVMKVIGPGAKRLAKALKFW